MLASTFYPEQLGILYNPKFVKPCFSYFLMNSRIWSKQTYAAAVAAGISSMA